MSGSLIVLFVITLFLTFILSVLMLKKLSRYSKAIRSVRKYWISVPVGIRVRRELLQWAVSALLFRHL